MLIRQYLWIAIAPMLFLAGCSRSNPANPSAVVAYTGATGTNPAPSAVASVPAARPVLAIPGGAALHVRLDETLDTRRNHAGDGFSATLSQPVLVDGQVAVPAGTRFSGHVTAAGASGRMKGRASIGLTLDSFRLEGREYRVKTTSVDRVSAAHKKRNALLIGGGAGLGAAIGAIAGGGKGALIGAGAGAGAGTVGAAATGKMEVGIPAETALRFALRTSVEL